MRSKLLFVSLIFTIFGSSMVHSNTREHCEKNLYKVPFHVVINPQIYIEETGTAEFFEGCLSVPEFLAIVPRATAVRVECLDENAQPVVIQAKGWYARILQHEIDHLNGTLYIDRAKLQTVMTEENYVQHWKNTGIKEVQTKLIGVCYGK
jgi:peptide deformylase